VVNNVDWRLRCSSKECPIYRHSSRLTVVVPLEWWHHQTLPLQLITTVHFNTQVRCRDSSIHIYVLFVILINRDDGKWMHFSDMDWRGGNARNKIFISVYWSVWVEGCIGSLKILEQCSLYIVCQIQLVYKLANFAMREWFGEEIGCVFGM